MDLKAPIGLYITTYEISHGKAIPVLSHIFWGNDIDEAIHYAKSHMIDDTFFTGSFTGSMAWKNIILHLSDTGEILSTKQFINQENIQDIMHELQNQATKIYQAQGNRGMLKIVQILSNKF